MAQYYQQQQPQQLQQQPQQQPQQQQQLQQQLQYQPQQQPVQQQLHLQQQPLPQQQQQQQTQAGYLQPTPPSALTFGPGQGVVTAYAGQPVYVQRVQRKAEYSPQDAKSAVVLGVIQLLTGILCVIFQSAATSIDKSFHPKQLYAIESVGAGIWCGFTFVITGILGVCSGKKNTKSSIIAFIVFNIISAVLIWILVGFDAANLVSTTYCLEPTISTTASQSGFYSSYILASQTSFGYVYYYSQYNPYYYTYYYTQYQYGSFSDCNTSFLDSWKAMDGLLMILAILEFSVAIAASIYCCKALGCCCSPQPTFIVQQNAPINLPTNAGVYVQGYATQPAYPSQGTTMQSPMGFIQPASSASASTPYSAHIAAAPYGMQPVAPHSLQAAAAHVESAASASYQGSAFCQPPATTASAPAYTDLASVLPSYEDATKDDPKR